jgi:hypothetical protein
MGSSSPCTNLFHVFFPSSIISREMARICNGGKKGVMAQTHNVVARYWGKGGIYVGSKKTPYGLH